MAEQELIILLFSAASLGLIHTVLGPDHYIPFIMMGKAGHWSLRKTCLVTVFCGIGHVAGSVLLGFIGIGIGIALHRIEFVESFRGDIAAWLFIAFGMIYFAWGLKKALRNKPHTHFHLHPGGVSHSHTHSHSGDHMHAHAHSDFKAGNPGHSSADEAAPSRTGGSKQKSSMSIWILFTIFIFGPCEPLIPLLMYPAASMSLWSVAAVAVVFMVFTVAAMTILVAMGYAGVSKLRLEFAERYMHAIAGFTLLLCGVGISFLGL